MNTEDQQPEWTTKPEYLDTTYDVPEDILDVPQTERQPISPQRAKRKPIHQEEGLVSALCRLLVDHQIGIAINLLLLLVLTHACFPRLRRQTRKFFELSYYNTESGRYGLGWDDICLVALYLTLFTGLRAAVIEYILQPLAQKVGISKQKAKVRFAEQAWILMYCCLFWSLGMYVFYTSDYWLNLHNMWTNWPDRELDGINKRYYLVQFAFWVQQILVVNIEEHRSDYSEMFTHHIVTSILLLVSYGYHQTKVGNVILVLMDAIDLILPTAKILKYMEFKVACDVAFGVFILVWIATRHILYLWVVYSVYAHLPQEMSFGCYYGSNQDLHGPIPEPAGFSRFVQPFIDPEGLVCWNQGVTNVFLGLLLSLQVILALWLSMIVRLAYKVVQGIEVDDPRSDNEGEDEDEQLSNGQPGKRPKNHQSSGFIEVALQEEEVGVESINLGKRPSTRRYRKGGAAASGVTLHSDRKELLGRIGCDKSE